MGNDERDDGGNVPVVLPAIADTGKDEYELNSAEYEGYTLLCENGHDTEIDRDKIMAMDKGVSLGYAYALDAGRLEQLVSHEVCPICEGWKPLKTFKLKVTVKKIF